MIAIKRFHLVDSTLVFDSFTDSYPSAKIRSKLDLVALDVEAQGVFLLSGTRAAFIPLSAMRSMELVEPAAAKLMGQKTLEIGPVAAPALVPEIVDSVPTPPPAPMVDPAPESFTEPAPEPIKPRGKPGPKPKHRG